MEYTEFKEKVNQLRDKDYGQIQYNTEECQSFPNTIIPSVIYNVNAIRGNTSFEEALEFYEEEREQLKRTGNFWRKQFIQYLRANTGCGFADAEYFVDTFIEAVKHKPSPAMDKPLKIKITWE